MELWLSELEGQVASEDFGKDLVSVQNLQKKIALLESDYLAHQDRVDGIKSLVSVVLSFALQQFSSIYLARFWLFNLI